MWSYFFTRNSFSCKVRRAFSYFNEHVGFSISEVLLGKYLIIFSLRSPAAKRFSDLY